MAPLATIDQFAQYLKVPVATLDVDQALLLLEAVSGAVRDLCRWSISAEDAVSFTCNADGSSVLAIPTLHLRSVESVTVEGSLLAATDYQWSEAGYLVREGGYWPARLRSVVAVVDHGWEPVPPQIVALVCSIASRFAETAGSGPVIQVRIGDFSKSFDKGTADAITLSGVEQMILDRHTITLTP